jgi:hypothetical protein
MSEEELGELRARVGMLGMTMPAYVKEALKFFKEAQDGKEYAKVIPLDVAEEIQKAPDGEVIYAEDFESDDDEPLDGHGKVTWVESPVVKRKKAKKLVEDTEPVLSAREQIAALPSSKPPTGKLCSRCQRIGVASCGECRKLVGGRE